VFERASEAILQFWASMKKAATDAGLAVAVKWWQALVAVLVFTLLAAQGSSTGEHANNS
jgi:hypothetical protein